MKMLKSDNMTYRMVVTRHLTADERAALPASIFTPYTTAVMEEDIVSFNATKERAAQLAAEYPAPNYIVCVEISPGPSIVMADEMATIANEQELRDIRGAA
jgi:hypothetical protein